MDNENPIDDYENGIFVPPSIQKKGDDWQKRSNSYWRTFVVDEFPKSVGFGWYSRVLSRLPYIGGNLIIDPVSLDEDLVSEDSEYISNLYSRKYRQEYDHDRREFNTRRVVEGAQHSIVGKTENKEYVKVAVFFMCKANSKFDLEYLTTLFYFVALEMGFSVRPIEGRHEDAIRVTSPTGFDSIEYYTVFTKETAVYLFAPVYF